MKKSHAELERYHYEAVRDNLEYRMTGQIEIMREEILMHIPRAPIEETEQNIVPPEPIILIDSITQLQGQILYLRHKLEQHIATPKRQGKIQSYKGIK